MEALHWVTDSRQCQLCGRKTLRSARAAPWVTYSVYSANIAVKVHVVHQGTVSKVRSQNVTDLVKIRESIGSGASVRNGPFLSLSAAINENKNCQKRIQIRQKREIIEFKRIG